MSALLFHQVLEPGNQQVVANETADEPQFTLGGLAPGLDYVVKVFAFNSRGRSEPYILDGFSLKVAENRMGELHRVECWLLQKRHIPFYMLLIINVIFFYLVLNETVLIGCRFLE